MCVCVQLTSLVSSINKVYSSINKTALQHLKKINFNVEEYYGALQEKLLLQEYTKCFLSCYTSIHVFLYKQNLLFKSK